MARKNKITTDPKAEKYQRERTEQLKQDTESWKSLQSSPPWYLSKIAKNAYRAILPALMKSEIVKQPDLTVVAALCVQVDIFRQAYKDIQKHGIQSAIYKPVVSPTGEVIDAHNFAGFKKNPAVTTLSDSTAKIKQLSAELGLTPQSRATLLNLNSDDDDSGDVVDSIAKILNGKGDHSA